MEGIDLISQVLNALGWDANDASVKVRTVAGLGFVLAFIYASSLTAQNLTAQITTSSPTIIGFGALLCFSPVLGLVGVVLGILGVVQKNDKKLFAVIGIVLNFLLILVFAVLILVGLVAQAGSLTL